jgi:hypothetical protein
VGIGHGGKTTGFVFLPVPTKVLVKVSGVRPTVGPQLLHLKRVINLLFQDSNVEKVLRLHGSPDSWDTLYKIFEVIRGDVGRLIVDLKWMSTTQKTRFTQTAQSPQVIGDEARHGRQKEQPPENPMPLQEAVDLIIRTTHAWINDKLSRRP